ncbi:MAG: hypothetical protein P1P84_02215, partial [Deferrisomatales bacterium]|nr:hypothetical protein [Deferrisomatales bacterium]
APSAPEVPRADPPPSPPSGFTASPEPLTAPAACAGTPEVGTPPPGVASDPKALWAELLAWAEDRNRPFWSVLTAHAELAGWDPQTRLGRVTYDDPSHEFFLKGKQELLVEFFSARAGGPARVEFECTGVGRAPRVAAGDTDHSRSIRKEAQQHPLVRQAVDVFDGDIEEVRVLKS